jgi:predicted RNase H-like nuclease
MAARENGSPGTSIQAWNLIARMVEVEAALEDRRRSAHEVHPECSFRLLDPRIGATSKKTARGTGLRLRALQGVLDLPPLDKAPPLVPLDDLLDATVVAWTASRIAKRAADLVILGPDDGPRITI